MTRDGISWNRELDQLRLRVQAMGPGLQDEAEKIVRESVNEGADRMRGFIETRGTGFEGRRGRVDEGYMLGDVAASEPQRDRRGVRGQFGWGVTGGKVQAYYRYQEQGFKHWRSGKDVAPMHALLDAYIQTRENFKRKIIKRLAKG
jgi:hypothetical protein